MSLLADAILISGSIIKTALAIQELGKEWYKPCHEWEDFIRKLGKLQIEHEVWKSQIHCYGMISDGGMVERLERSRALLQLEERKLRELQSKIWSRCWFPHSAMFPPKLAQIMQTVLEDYADIPDTLSRLSNAANVLYNTSSMRLPSTGYRYVPLTKTETELYHALEMNHPCPLVTVLHGGPGRGKSSLVRQVALKYLDAISQSSVGAVITAKFHEIVVLECGPKAEILEKQLELFHKLGGLGTSAREGEGKLTVSISQLLRIVLKDLAILIILDDVWDSEFLRSFVVLGGDRARFLVTTRVGSLWRHASTIKIQDIDLFDARRILASHVGLEDNQIPHHLQDIADSMIAQTDRNPLALASMATAISTRRRTDRKEWKASATELFMSMEATQNQISNLTMMMHPRSFWATMRLSLKSLSEGALELLLLTSMFEGPSIPEEVVQIVYSHYKQTNKGAIMFHRWRNELEDNGSMLKTTMYDLLPNSSGASDVMRTNWSLHVLHKGFVVVEMEEEIRSSFDFMLRMSDSLENDHERLVFLLCALYLDEEYAQRALRKLGYNESILRNKARRTAIEPLLYLLQDTEEECEHWPFIRQVVVKYICNGELDTGGFYGLLNERTKPHSALLACSVLESIALIEDKCLITEGRSTSIMAPLVRILEDGDVDIQERALRALVSFSVQPQNKMLLLGFPGCVKQMVKLLTDYDYPIIQQLTARALANLASNGMDSEHGNLILLESPSCVADLRRLLSDDDYPAVQAHAARALANLVWNNIEIQKRYFKLLGCIADLVRILCKDDCPAVQEEAARVLGTLAWNNPKNGKLITSLSTGCIPQLAKLLCRDDHPFVQFTAVWALLNLIQNNVENQQSVLDSPGSVRALVKILCKNEATTIQFEENPSTVHHAAQQAAACILVTLAWNNVQMRKILLKSPECMKALANILQGLDEWKLPVSNRDNLAWNNVDHQDTISERQLMSLRQLSQIVSEDNHLGLGFQPMKHGLWTLPPKGI
ncbi:hypothetical protein R1flu_010865 [Riccia fluitans]|uniref:Vacuolar protein 8 n=1 Tax=Riccia fluitans TaxID=41844 RepID=A0ABD1Z743_9MARC